jgi:hypothetical protein
MDGDKKRLFLELKAKAIARACIRFNAAKTQTAVAKAKQFIKVSFNATGPKVILTRSCFSSQLFSLLASWLASSWPLYYFFVPCPWRLLLIMNGESSGWLLQRCLTEPINGFLTTLHKTLNRKVSGPSFGDYGVFRRLA